MCEASIYQIHNSLHMVKWVGKETVSCRFACGAQRAPSSASGPNMDGILNDPWLVGISPSMGTPGRHLGQVVLRLKARKGSSRSVSVPGSPGLICYSANKGSQQRFGFGPNDLLTCLKYRPGCVSLSGLGSGWTDGQPHWHHANGRVNGSQCAACVWPWMREWPCHASPCRCGILRKACHN